MRIRELLVLWLLAACHRAPEPSLPPRSQPEAAPVVDAGATMPADAAMASDAAVAAMGPAPAPEFRPFVAPEPMTIAPPTPRGAKVCTRHEEMGRELAALDAELRRQGGMLLQPITGPQSMRRDGSPNPDLAAGRVIRGLRGERQLVVSERGGACSGPPPPVGIDAEGEVFAITPRPRASKTRKSRACGANCVGRCGARMPDRSIVVEVPEGARLGPRRTVEFPMKVRLVFGPATPCRVP